MIVFAKFYILIVATKCPKMKKLIDCKDKLFPCLTKFRKGAPTLMYRRLHHTYARGDDIVVISLLE